MTDLISISHIKVRSDRIEATVRIEENAPVSTDENLMKRVLQDFPFIASHACKNDKGPVFGSVMNGTSLPHLLEHMSIELQGKALLEEGYSSSDSVLVGITQWSKDCENEALISLSFVNDVIALRSLKQALKLLNSYISK